MMAVLDILGVSGAVLASSAAVLSLRRIVDTLWANRSLRERIASDPKERDELLRLLVKLQTDGAVHDQELIAKLIAVIEPLLDSLPDMEKRELMEGMHQQSRDGQKAFVTKLVRSATG